MRTVNIFVLTLDKENGTQKVVFPVMQLITGEVGFQAKVYATFL